jgi:hypothetical protein
MPKIFLALAILAATPLAAQQTVGSTPAQSPYHDVKPSQNITLFGGYFDTQSDEIGATPRSGALFGIRYGIPVGGPSEFYARLRRVSSHREAFDPALPAGANSLGDQNVAIYLADVGFDLNLTGRKSWHGIIPLVGFGLGIATANNAAKKDPYDFGTQFAVSADAGIRIVPTNSFALRLTVGNTLYQNHYPAAYFVPAATGAAPLLGAGTSRSAYKSNWNYTAGLTFPIFR